MHVDMKEIRKKLKNLSIDSIIVLKNNAYGLGLEKIASFLMEFGFHRFAVISLDEAIFLRNMNQETEILLLGKIEYEYLDEARFYSITLSITSIRDLGYVKNSIVHIKVNTGMNRFGIEPRDLDEVYNYLSASNLITGIYSHIGSYIDSYEEQLELFSECTRKYDFIDRHLSSSKGIGKNKFNERIGFYLYDKSIKISRNIVEIRKISRNDFIGYDYKAPYDMYVGIINIGYFDGLTRNNEGRNVMINKKFFKIVGHICMNHTFVEIDNSISIGDNVYLLNDEISLYYIASYLNTTPYEVLTQFKTLNKKYVY